mmetsp:Transcript_65164/g.187307  ORF Transcript_65164/g.187307 Transcript_65164/m.187307 type:complete len:317 (-) Transcript_65164:1211-2161(-)
MFLHKTHTLRVQAHTVLIDAKLILQNALSCQEVVLVGPLLPSRKTVALDDDTVHGFFKAINQDLVRPRLRELQEDQVDDSEQSAAVGLAPQRRLALDELGGEPVEREGREGHAAGLQDLAKGDVVEPHRHLHQAGELLLGLGHRECHVGLEALNLAEPREGSRLTQLVLATELGNHVEVWQQVVILIFIHVTVHELRPIHRSHTWKGHRILSLFKDLRTAIVERGTSPAHPEDGAHDTPHDHLQVLVRLPLAAGQAAQLAMLPAIWEGLALLHQHQLVGPGAGRDVEQHEVHHADQGPVGRGVKHQTRGATLHLGR